MNIKEGMRRLGLLVGCCGAITGGMLAYPDAESLPQTKAAQHRFESLMDTPAMREVAKSAVTTAGQNPEFVKELREHNGTSVEVDKDGIEGVLLDETGRISSIDLTTGRSVKRVEPPPLMAYFGLLLYPLFGFLIPWGCFRLLTWVGIGFFVQQQ